MIKKSFGKAETYILVLLALASTLFVGGLSSFSSPNLPKTDIRVRMVDKNTSAQQGLQMNAPEAIIITPSPSPSPSLAPLDTPTVGITTVPTIPVIPPIILGGGGCEHDTANASSGSCACGAGEGFAVNCQDGSGTLQESVNGSNTLSDPGSQGGLNSYCATAQNGGHCWGKPVIYLYPEKPTNVSVKIITPGKIIASNPLYPPSGWQNVFAVPGGKLFYKGKAFTELFYESSVVDGTFPKNGILLSSAHLENELRGFVRKLGLISNEENEFITYWLPRLQKLNTPYVFATILTPEEKDRVDHVEISPKPDTILEFLVYFKPVANFYTPPLLVLPILPTRNGFTAVEWGGTIETN